MDNGLLQYFPRQKTHNIVYANSIRPKHLRTTLPNDQKMELYNAAIANQLDAFKALVEQKHYPLMEECSTAGFYWTSLHYAAHYGSCDIVEYILEYYKKDKDMIEKVNLQSNLGLSPLLITVKNCTNAEAKKGIMELYVKFDCIDYDICSQENEDIFDVCIAQGVLDYFLGIIKED